MRFNKSPYKYEMLQCHLYGIRLSGLVWINIFVVLNLQTTRLATWWSVAADWWFP